MNVSILVFVVFWGMRCLRFGETLASGMTVILCAAYAFVTDVGPPVWRAVLMLTVYLGVRLLYRERSMLNALGAAALGLMVVDPKAFLGPSFQLTFLAVFIIAAVGPSVGTYFAALPARPASLGFDRVLATPVVQMRLDLRLIANRLTYFVGARIPRTVLSITARGSLSVFELLCVSSLMQVGLALPMVYYFHRATVVGIPANALAVPLTELLMPSAVLSVALSYVAEAFAKLPATVAAIALHGITSTVRAGWVEYRGPSRSHAGTDHHSGRGLHARHRNGVGATASGLGHSRSRVTCGRRSLGQCFRSRASISSRRARTYRHRCRPG